MTLQALGGGFDDPARQSARAFRAALDALSRPGRITRVEGAAPPAPLSAAAAGLLLALADAATPLWLAPSHDLPQIRDWITFHTGAPLLAAAEKAQFVLGDWESLQPVSRFSIGLPDYPDRSATLIVEMPALRPEGVRLTGPGIAGAAHLSLPETAAFRANHALFPLGFDTFLTAGSETAALPRSTRIEAA
jgi:alpha-D-ribose 1-methylphosphonate 5-triphosphate synthase subunit PhnH